MSQLLALFGHGAMIERLPNVIRRYVGRSAALKARIKKWRPENEQIQQNRRQNRLANYG
jgi:hypothetical protein